MGFVLYLIGRDVSFRDQSQSEAKESQSNPGYFWHSIWIAHNQYIFKVRKARKNVNHQAAIAFSFALDFLRGWRDFSAKPKQSWISFNTQ